MKKIFAILLTLVMVMSMFTGCDSGHDHDPTTAITEVITDPTGETTIDLSVDEAEAPVETTVPETEAPAEAPTEEPKVEETKPVHQHSYISKVTKAATCTEDGVNTFTCACGASYTESIAAEHDYECTDTRPATCSNTGDKTYTCGNCGHTYKEILPKNEHVWSEWVVTKEPTTTTYGQKIRECELCYGAQFESIDPLSAESEPTCNHNYTSEHTSPACVENPSNQDRCDVVHTMKYTCTKCGDSYTGIYEVPHDWGKWIVTTEPTTENNGGETRWCQDERCQAFEGRVIPKLPADGSGYDEGSGEGGYYWFGNIKKPWDCASQGHHVTNKDRQGKCIQNPSCIHDEIWEYTCDVVGCGATWTESKGGAGGVAHKMSAADQAKITKGADYYIIKCACGMGCRGSNRDEAMVAFNAHAAEKNYDYCGEIAHEREGHYHNFPSSTFNCAVCGEAIAFKESYALCGSGDCKYD